MFRSSISTFLILSFSTLMIGLLTATSIIAAQALSRYSLAGRIAQLAQTDRKLFDALVTVRAQVPKNSTALIDSDNPAAIIQSAHLSAERSVESAMQALARTDVATRDSLLANISAAWRRLETLQANVRSEAGKARDQRNLHELDTWREAVHGTTDALGAASAVIGNVVRIGDPLIAEMVQIRRVAWTIRDRYGLQCSMLRPSIADNSRLNAVQLEAWSGDRAIYVAAWQTLDELLLRPGVSAVVRERVAFAHTATRTAQSQIDAIVARLNDTGQANIAGDRWTALCDGPFEDILAIARQAQEEATQRADEIRSSASRMLFWSGGGLLTAFVFGAFALLTVQRRLARPMRGLISTISRLSRRELRERVPIPGSFDELGQMARALEDLRQSALEAERLQAAMSRFTADASHQMRTPLSVLRAHISVLSVLLPADGEARDSLHDIQGAADRLQRLLIQLLNLARAEAAQALGAPRDPVDLRALIQEVAAAHASQASDAGLELHFEAEARLFSSNANPVVIKEIISNLIDNAIRYNHRGGSVIVRLYQENEKFVAEVEDDGPGIPDSEHEKVFTRFYRMNRDQNQPGSGLGLAIVRSFADALNAQLSLGTGAQNRGLKVRIAFA